MKRSPFVAALKKAHSGVERGWPDSTSITPSPAHSGGFGLPPDQVRTSGAWERGDGGNAIQMQKFLQMEGALLSFPRASPPSEMLLTGRGGQKLLLKLNQERRD